MQHCSAFSKMIVIFQLRLNKCHFWYCNLFWFCKLFYMKINYQLMMNEMSLMITYLILSFRMYSEKAQSYRFYVWCFLSKTCISLQCLELVAERWSQASYYMIISIVICESLDFQLFYIKNWINYELLVFNFSF